MKLRRVAAKLTLAAALAFGLFKGAEAGFSPPAAPLAPVFNQQAAKRQTAPVREYRLASATIPENVGEIWRVRLGAWEMTGGGHHTFLEFSPYPEKSKVCPDPDRMFQVHGIAMDKKRHTFAQIQLLKASSYTRYFSGDYVLKAFGVDYDLNRKVFGKEPDIYVDLYYGSKDEVLKLYLDANAIADAINRKSDGYDLLDRNSNSVQRTMLEGLGLPVPDAYAPLRLNALGSRIWTPGLELSLLPKDWNRQAIRDAGGYGHLSGDALDEKAQEASGDAPSVWNPPPKPRGPAV